MTERVDYTAASREAVPALIARVRELEAEVAHTRQVAHARAIDEMSPTKSEADRDAALAVIAKVRALLGAPSDERGITWWEWIEGGLGGSLYADLRAALGPVPSTGEGSDGFHE